MRNLLNATALTICMAAGASMVTPAMATSDASTSANAAPAANDSNSTKGADMQHTNLRQQLTDQLQKAGYTQVKVTPSSFFIEAKDKKGNPVAMVVGPDTFAEVTSIPLKGQGQSAQQSQNDNAQQK